MKRAKHIAWLLAAGLAVVIIVFIVNQTVQVSLLASAVHPTFGVVVLYGLLAFYAGVALIPLVLLLRLPPKLVAPPNDSPEYPLYLRRLCSRLRQNPHVKHLAIDAADLSSIERAIDELNKISTTKIKAVAKQVFVGTAVSQYGKLDTLIVFGTLVRMVWQVATVYNQRPSLGELATLYLNVGATAIVANEIESIAIFENQLEPIFAELMGPIIAAQLSTATQILVNSLVEGSANAFLALRVGLIAQGYSAAISKPEKSALRMGAVCKAAQLLGEVVAESVGEVSKAVARIASRAVKNTAEQCKEVAKGSLQTATAKVRKIFRGVGAFLG